jgi:hypothetical protein
MTEKECLELLLARVEEMRTHQRDFFARRQTTDKQLSIKKEKEVDDLCKVLRRRGYDPERFKTNTNQGRLM